MVKKKKAIEDKKINMNQTATYYLTLDKYLNFLISIIVVKFKQNGVNKYTLLTIKLFIQM